MAASNFSMQCGLFVAAFIVGTAVRRNRRHLRLPRWADRLVSTPSKSSVTIASAVLLESLNRLKPDLRYRRVELLKIRGKPGTHPWSFRKVPK
jgi:hypothetical protein